MATIRTAIQIVDKFSPALGKLSNSVKNVQTKLEALQSTSSDPLQIKGLRDAHTELSKLSNQMGKLQARSLQASNGMRKFDNSMRNTSNVASSLTSTLRSLAGAWLTWTSASNAIKLTDQYTSITARLGLIKGEFNDIKDLEYEILQAAERSRSSYFDTATLVSRMGMNAKNAFGSTKEMVDFAELFNKKLVIAGANYEEMRSAMIQLSQAMGSGVMRGEELNSVFESAPNIIQDIADYMDVPIGKIRKLAEQGLLTSDLIKDAMFAMADETNKTFEKMPKTFAQIWTSFKNYAFRAFQPVMDKLRDLANSDEFQKFVLGAIRLVKLVAEGVIWVMEKIGKLFSFVKENMWFFAPILGVITAGFIALGAAIAFAKLQALYHALVSVMQTAYLVALEFATNGAAAGFAVLSAAMSINPVMLYVLAVVAFIGVIYLAIAIINKFCGTSLSTTGLIAGAFMFLYAIVYNIIVKLWNRFAIFAEFLVNVFKHPIYSIKSLFVNFGIDFLDSCIAMTKGWDKFATSIANAFVDAINWVIDKWNAFMDILPDKVKSALGLDKGGKVEHTASITSDLTNAKESLEKMLGDKPDDYWTAPKLEYKDVGATTLKGYDEGEKFGNDVSSFFDDMFNAKEFLNNNSSEELQDYIRRDDGLIGNLDDLLGDNWTDEIGKNANKGVDTPAAFRDKYGDIAEKMDKILGNTDKIAGNTEDLEFMREVGERDVINRITAPTIQINNKVDNNVSSDMDLKKVKDALLDWMVDTVSSTVEGIHTS